MNNGNIDKTTLMGAIIAVAPQLIPWFDPILVKQQYTVAELNSLMRYQLIQLSADTMAVREWLCESADTHLWIHYFCQHVVPFISECLRTQYISPSNFMKLMAG